MTCSTESSRRLHSPCSRGSKSAWSVAPWRSMLTWMGLGIVIAFAASAVVFASGCTRTVLVQEGSPLRIGPNNATHVYARVDGEWQLSPNKVEIPEGWYLVPPSYVDDDPLPGDA